MLYNIRFMQNHAFIPQYEYLKECTHTIQKGMYSCYNTHKSLLPMKPMDSLPDFFCDLFMIFIRLPEKLDC